MSSCVQSLINDEPQPPESLTDPVARWEANMRWVAMDPYLAARTGQTCPVWGDEVPYKSITVIVPAALAEAASYCIFCIMGAEPADEKVLDDGRVAFRGDYAAW